MALIICRPQLKRITLPRKLIEQKENLNKNTRLVMFLSMEKVSIKTVISKTMYLFKEQESMFLNHMIKVPLSTQHPHMLRTTRVNKD